MKGYVQRILPRLLEPLGSRYEIRGVVIFFWSGVFLGSKVKATTLFAEIRYQNLRCGGITNEAQIRIETVCRLILRSFVYNLLEKESYDIAPFI